MPVPDQDQRAVRTRTETASEDHRVRVARERRHRTRAKLFQSVKVVCSGSSVQSPAVIDDVVRHAGVARGTFYKYFSSLEQAIEEFALVLADEMTAGIAAVYEPLDDPVMRTATGFQTFLLRGLIDHDWGRFLARIGLLGGDSNLITTKIQSDIALGLAAGVYRVPSVEVATDLLMGAKIEAIRRIIGGSVGVDYIRLITTMVLTSFGVDPELAAIKVAAAFERIAEMGPVELEWWRPLDPD